MISVVDDDYLVINSFHQQDCEFLHIIKSVKITDKCVTFTDLSVNFSH